MHFIVKHRGVSEVVGSLLMLAIVGSIAAIVLTIGLTSITDFATFLVDVDISEDTLKERIVINNVDFNNANKNVKIYLRNVGLNDITIDSIAITNIDTQESILLDNANTSPLVIQAKAIGNTGDLTTTISCADFSDTICKDVNYNISVVTSRGNIFEMEVRPFRL